MVEHPGVLIDFTDLCYTSISFVKAIAEKAGAKVTLIHVADKKVHDTQKKFAPFVSEFQNAGLNVNSLAPIGNFGKIIPEVVA